MSKQFKDGDVVFLKTGSPPMTVEDIRSDEIVSVAWFDGAVLYRDGFSVAELVPAVKNLQGGWSPQE